MASIGRLIFKSSSTITKPLEIVLRAPITIDLNITFIVFSYLARYKYLSLFSLSFIFSLWPAGRQSLILLFIIIIIIYSLEFLPSANADGLSQECKWQQVTISLQDSSQYSGRSQ